MLSNKCKYAIRAVLFLAAESCDGCKSSCLNIAGRLDLPVAFTGKILQELARKNIIKSIKGPNGGFWLPEESMKRPLLDIVEAIDTLEFFNACGLGLQLCSEDHPCPIHSNFKKSKNLMLDLFQSTTIAEVAQGIRHSDVFLADIET